MAGHSERMMSTGSGTGEMPAISPESLTVGDRLDPVRTLLHRASTGDRDAAGALIDMLGPRIHGLGVHVLGSSARAEKLTVWVLRTCLRDAAQLAGSGIPGDAAVLDRARRAAVSTDPSGDVRSLVASDTADDRTCDRREVLVKRALLDLPARERALVESAAQGRFPFAGPARLQTAMVLAALLNALVPFGEAGLDDETNAKIRALAALDALALADDDERARLRSLTDGSEAAGMHRHAIEAAAHLALLTAKEPSRRLHEAVLEDFGSPAPEQHQAQAPEQQPEAAYHGTYATPVLGTDTQRRMVGPPAVAGGAPSAAPSQTTAPSTAPAPPPPIGGSPIAATAAPAFAYSSKDQADLSRRRRRQARAHDLRHRSEHSPWPTRVLSAVCALALVGALVSTGLLLNTRHHLIEAKEFADVWSELSVSPDARLVPGLSDNGTWRAVIATDQAALWAEGVTEYEPESDQKEVLQLWGERDGTPVDLGVLTIPRSGTIQLLIPEKVERLRVTREHAPQNRSGTPSQRVVATLDPELSGT